MANLSNHSHGSLGHGIPIMTTELVVYFPADWNYFEGFRKTAQETMALSSMIWACNFLEKFWDRHHLISNWKNQEERMMAYPPSNQTWLAGKFPSKMDTRMARTEGVSCFRILNHESVVPPNQVTTWSARLWERQLLRRHVCVYIYIYVHLHVYIYMYMYRIDELENKQTWEWFPLSSCGRSGWPAGLYKGMQGVESPDTSWPFPDMLMLHKTSGDAGLPLKAVRATGAIRDLSR